MLTILAGATSGREIMLERLREGIAKTKSEGNYKAPRSTPSKSSARRGWVGPASAASQLSIARNTVSTGS